MRIALCLALIGSLAGCNIPGPSLAGYQGLQTKVMWHYRLYAVEENGICRSPEMKAVTRTEILDDNSSKLVLRLRYSYLDTAYRIEDRPVLFNNCEGFGTRQFTIAKEASGLKVIHMSGPQKAVPS